MFYNEKRKKCKQTRFKDKAYRLGSSSGKHTRTNRQSLWDEVREPCEINTFKGDHFSPPTPHPRPEECSDTLPKASSYDRYRIIFFPSLETLDRCNPKWVNSVGKKGTLAKALSRPRGLGEDGGPQPRVLLSDQVLLPAFVFVALERDDCGGCGRDDCGKRCAVGPRSGGGIRFSGPDSRRLTSAVSSPPRCSLP